MEQQLAKTLRSFGLCIRIFQWFSRILFVDEKCQLGRKWSCFEIFWDYGSRMCHNVESCLTGLKYLLMPLSLHIQQGLFVCTSLLLLLIWNSSIRGMSSIRRGILNLRISAKFASEILARMLCRVKRKSMRAMMSHILSTRAKWPTFLLSDICMFKWESITWW